MTANLYFSYAFCLSSIEAETTSMMVFLSLRWKGSQLDFERDRKKHLCSARPRYAVSSRWHHDSWSFYVAFWYMPWALCAMDRAFIDIVVAVVTNDAVTNTASSIPQFTILSKTKLFQTSVPSNDDCLQEASLSRLTSKLAYIEVCRPRPFSRWSVLSGLSPLVKG